MKTALSYLQPDISVVLVAQDKSKNLFKIIDCLLGQTFKSWELIIVDNGSKDNAFQFVNPFVEKHDNIRYIKQKAKSFVSALNIGIQSSLGKHITFIGIDDRFLPGHLQNLYEVSNLHHENFLYHGGFEVIGETKIRNILKPNEKISVYDAPLLYTFFAPREIFFEFGGFKEFGSGSEVDFLDRISKKVNIIKVQEPKTYIHVNII